MTRLCILIISLGICLALPAAEPDNANKADFKILKDRFYAGTNNPRQALDLLIPTKPKQDKLPVIVFIHGGGWRNGDKSRGLQQRLGRYAASGRYAAISVGYRLSGEAKWPAQIHDCKAAIRWIRANAAKYNLDATHIGIWGTSAGGHLVAMLGTSAGVESMDGSLGPHTNVSSSVTCVADYFGPTNFLEMDNASIPESRFLHDAPDSPESLLIGGPIQEHPEKVASANPVVYVDKTDAPFLIVHGTKDPLVPYNQSERLHSALTKAGTPSTFVTVEGGGHGKGFGPDVTALLDRFFEHYLLDQKSEWRDVTVKASNSGR